MLAPDSNAPKKKLRIMLVDDNPADRVLVRASLRKRYADDYQFIEYGDAGAALDFLAAHRADLPDCLFVDINMPGIDGFEMIARINDLWGHMPMPLIVLTGSNGNEAREMEHASQALALGAQDYLSKRTLHDGLLNRVIHNAIERFKLINENKRILANLNDREEQYRLATEAADLGTWVFTADGKFKCTEHCKKLHGLGGDGDYFSHDDFFAQVHQDDREELNARLKEIIASGETRDFKIDYRIRQPDGAHRWASAKGRVYNAKNAPPRLIGTVQDITVQKQAGDILRANEARLRQLADTMPQMVWITLPDGRPEYFNQRWYDFTGAGAGDPIDADGWPMVFHPDDRERARTRWRASVDHSEPYEIEYRLRHHSGDYRWVLGRAVPVRDDNGAVLRWYGTYTEIHNQLEREQFIRRVLESSPDCINVLDLNGNLLSINETGLRQLEIDDMSSCLGRPWSHLWSAAERQSAQRALAGACRGESVAFDGVCHTAKGTPKWWEVVLTPLLGPTGEPEKLLVISRDISERKKIENALVETLKVAEDARQKAESANLAKSEFLANMSHEIRTPMNAVIGLSNILARSAPLTERQQECIRTLQLSADSLLALINDLLDISKIETRSVQLEKIPFDLGRMMQEVISVMSVRAREKNLHFALRDRCPPPAFYLGDQSRIKQVLMNLCSNAIKFTDRGSVELSIACRAADQAGIDHVTISCVDTGIGIAADKIDTIFHKFVQADSSINRKYGGTGLGLAITKTLVEIMGGSIAVESDPGRGSTFTVILPLQRAPSQAVVAGAVADAPAIDHAGAAEPRVLLVEDYPANVLVATMFLEQFGYAYDVASNGQEAVEKVRSGTGYTAILMDVQMHGMNGLEATRQIRLHEQQARIGPIPIIGMTAHALAGDRERCLSVGMDDYISKPFNPDELFAKLQACNQR